MLQPMHPSIEPQSAEKEHARQADREPEEEEEFDSDEIIIECQKVPLLQKNVDRIEEIFHVVVGLGLRAVEGIEMQWISIQGLADDRTAAKCYIKALCSPGKKLAFNFPDDLHATLSHPDVRGRLEKQSNTAILFPSLGQAVIQGEDDLAVTLAMSAIEDIIEKYKDVNVPDVSSPSATGEVSDRLDRELRRLSNQNKELYGEEYDVETLTSLPGPVKRTLLKQYMDDSRQNSVDEPKSELTYSQDPDQTVPMTLVGKQKQADTPGGRFVDLHPDRRDNKKEMESGLTVDLHASSRNSSLSLSLDLGNDQSDKDSSFVDLSKSPARESPVGADPYPQDKYKNAPVIDLTNETPTRPPNNSGLISDAIKFALTSGYTIVEIEEVQKDYGDILTTAQFLQVLHTNRREKTQKHAVTVSELEAVHIPRPPQDRASDTSTSKEDTSADKDDHRPVTPTGKQQAPQSHSQGPKMKKGKLSKTTPNKQTGKARGKRNRRSPTQENIDKMEVVSLMDEEDGRPAGAAGRGGGGPGAIHDILQHSPHGKPNKEGEKNRAVLMNYLERLTQDYDEEDSSDIEELRTRNSVRRAMLKQAIEVERARQQEAKAAGGGKEEEGEGEQQEEEEEEEGEWVTADKDGRHRFPQTPSSTEKKKPAESNTGTPSEPPYGTVQADGAAEELLQPTANGAGGGLDVLDDFSLPFSGNGQDVEDGRVRAQRQYAGRNQEKHGRGRYNPTQRTHPQNQSPQRHKIQPLSQQPQGQQTKPQAQGQQYMAVAQRTHPPHQPPHQLQPPHQAFYQAPKPETYAAATSKLNTNLRYIIIDGSNVAMTHGNHQIFSCKGIKICIDYFRRRGHQEVTAFVPRWRTHAPRPDHPIRDQHMLEELSKGGFLVFTPSRRFPGKNIVCYDDKFVLRLAQETDGIVVSNDNYRDLWHEKREWRQIIEQRLLMFSFVGDIFMAPDDPLGRDGPPLDVFLRKSNDLFPAQDIANQQDRQHYNRPNHNNQGAWATRGRQGQYQGRPIQGQPDPGHYQGRAIQGQLDQGQYQGRQVDPGQYQGRPIQGQTDQGQYQGRLQGQGGRNPAQPGGYNYNQRQAHGPGFQGGNNQGHGHGHFAYNAHGHNHFNQNPQETHRQRPASTTEWLKMKLFVIFPDKEPQIELVLKEHPLETDVNKVIEYMLEER